ncbi:MAG TPA: ABC transporter ATP-binding protein [Gaiellaceae bacterium]|nr:ABC transporter ATP-binding protein [Gaiellaceae bacterium]
MASAPAAIELRGITKRFPGVVANDRVDFAAAAGEVHALLGENGAGKSTLSHIMSGLYRPDEGEIRLHGKPVSFNSPRDAIDAGIFMVHQHFRLVERFTVAENLILGDRRGAGRRFRLRPGAVTDQVRRLGERYRLPVDPRARVWQLSVGERQRVEILKALYEEAQVLILDEPTAVLTPDEAATLFETVREIAADGRTVVFISHKMHEVKAVSDRVTVLRAGRVVATAETAEATPQSLARLMVGRELQTVQRRRAGAADAEPVLVVEGLSAPSHRARTTLKDVDLTVRAGEIVAVAGVAGNGQRELAEAIAGLRPRSSGSVQVAGRPLRNGDPRSAYRAGLGYVPEDRLGTGVAPNLPLSMNIELKSYRDGSLGPFLRLGRMRERAERAIETYAIKARGPEAEADTLSGGNIQKVVLAREFAGNLKALIAASPTRGLDVSAVETVHRHLCDAADRGVAVLLISEDLDEILALADRILVMYEGRLTPVENRDDVGEIAELMAGGDPATAAPA